MSYDFQTSYPAYQEVKQNIAYCNAMVLQVIKRYGPMNDNQIADKLGWKINCITNRRGELVELGKVMSAFKQVNPETNRTVNYWQLKTETIQQKLF